MEKEIIFPSLDNALDEPNGLLAIGGNLLPKTLLSAYQQGIFPWFSNGEPILWWSPEPRAVIFIDQYSASKSLKKFIKKVPLRVTLNHDFSSVINNCAAPRPNQTETWITPEMISSYTQLHEMGYAHSIEVWQDQSLVGGIYGISQGRFFFGESMFSHISNGSKVAITYLIGYLKLYGFLLLDCQVPNPHLTSLGSENISRTEFITLIQKWVQWKQDAELWKPKNLNDLLFFNSTQKNKT